MTVATAAGCDVLTYNETCTFNVVWTIPAGATDPYVNVVEAAYQVDGFPNTYTHAASHSVNLFAPCIKLTKTGDELSKIGDPITYDITLENCSTPNTPALTCMITDPLFPAGFTVPSACSAGNCSFSFDYTPVAADPDPLVNTASVACTIAGFPNTVADEASATTNLFQPSVDLEKVCDPLSKVGDPIACVVTIHNTSSADSTDLILDSFVDSKVPGIVPPAACSPLAPGASCTFSYNYTVRTSDPDPLVNTATARYHPFGFTNDIRDSDSFSIDLLHPNYTLSKTCAEEPIFVGSIALFNVTLRNTGDVELIVTLDEDVTGTGGVVIPAGTPISLPVNTTRTYQAGVPNAPYPLVNNTVHAVATLPAWTGLPNQLAKMASDSCTTSYWAFTPGFWKTHGPTASSGHIAWGAPGDPNYTSYYTTDLLGDVFNPAYLTEKPRGSNTSFADQTLMQALSFKGGSGLIGAKEVLLRAGVAALLNASFHETFDYPPVHPKAVAVFDPVLGRNVLMSCDPADPVACPSPMVYYPYTSQGVIDAVNAALATGNRTTILALAYELDGYNNGIHYIDWNWPPPHRGMLKLNDLRDVPSGRRN